MYQCISKNKCWVKVFKSNMYIDAVVFYNNSKCENNNNTNLRVSIIFLFLVSWKSF